MKKKETGFDKLARLIKTESDDIRENMATDIERLEGNTAKFEMRLGAKIDRVDSKLSAFENHEVDKRKQLEVRITRIEKKVGV